MVDVAFQLKKISALFLLLLFVWPRTPKHTFRITDLVTHCDAISSDIIVSGMQRFHAVCPTKEEASLAVKNTRYFLKKTPERLVLLLTCDEDKKEKYSFMYQGVYISTYICENNTRREQTQKSNPKKPRKFAAKQTTTKR